MLREYLIIVLPGQSIHIVHVEIGDEFSQLAGRLVYVYVYDEFILAIQEQTITKN